MNSMSGIRVQSTVDISNNTEGKSSVDKVITSTELLHKKANELSISDAALQKALEKVNKVLKGIETRLEYSVHKTTGDIMVKVINEDTKEVIREVPPEKIIDLVVKLQELSGLIIDEKR
ncbi:flagellar protein FlaG [Paenibacillus terrigena]|uniref:flagellar protein FlaG n=1 Tax=Paenibacillus terrigena TaxID=369333 RepID=UPI0003A879F3|nr:flagellar protein FlaG [Paenibacillus terrigena]